MRNRIAGYDLIRSGAILLVFLSHIITKQTSNKIVLTAVCSLSPGMTMSLLGFISAALLSSHEDDFGSFLIKRFSRIYISLWICLVTVLTIHAALGKDIISQHTVLHFTGLSAFFDLFSVQNKATIGSGLWFITIITLMYLLLPLLKKIFSHPHRFIHLVIIVLLSTGLNFTMYGTSSVWNVAISFAVGVYMGCNNLITPLISTKKIPWFGLLGCFLLLTLAALATSQAIPYEIRGVLFAFYPLAFLPLLFSISDKLPVSFSSAIAYFSGISYEFYILHFYFINERLHDFFTSALPLTSQILISFTMTFVLASGLSKAASISREAIDRYLLHAVSK